MPEKKQLAAFWANLHRTYKKHSKHGKTCETNY